jgi:hypothetical protein
VKALPRPGRVDHLLALAGFSVMGRSQTWAEGRRHLSPETLRRATTPLDWLTLLLGTESYEGCRPSAWQQLVDALQRDADE